MDSETFWGEPISVYTRKQALADGVLVDVTPWASEGTDGMIGGFMIPVALSAGVWADINAIPADLEGLQDVRGRAHDVLWMARCAAQRAGNASEVEFEVLMVLGDSPEVMTYLMVCGPDDDGEPCVTIMRHEDR